MMNRQADGIDGTDTASTRTLKLLPVVLLFRYVMKRLAGSYGDARDNVADMTELNFPC